MHQLPVRHNASPSLSLKHSPSTKLSTPPQRINRLKRPAALRLGNDTTSDAAEPRSALEKRYELIRECMNAVESRLETAKTASKRAVEHVAKEGET